MKIAHKLILASTVLGLALSQSAHAQTPVLVAGWDFNGLNSAGLQAVGANYSDNYATLAPQDTTNVPAFRGTFLANGTGGTENLPSSAANGVSISNTPDLIDRQIYTRSSGGGQFFDNSYTGTNDNAMQVGMKNTLGTQTFGFQVDTTDLSNLTSVSLWLAKSSAQNLTIDWGYQVGAGPVQSLSSLNLSSLAAGTYAEYTVNLNGILGGQGLVTILGSASTTSATSFGLRIDNVGIYSIPEPSTYAAILSALTLGVVAMRRRRQTQLA